MPVLKKLEKIPEITAINPGRIVPVNNNSNQLELKIQYKTPSGLKCIARGNRAVQEIFIVGKGNLETILKESLSN